MAIYKHVVPAGSALRLVAAGGVAANKRLRAVLAALAEKRLQPACAAARAVRRQRRDDRLGRALSGWRTACRTQGDFDSACALAAGRKAPKAIGAGVKA